MYATEAQVRSIHKGIEDGDDIDVYMQSANAIIEDVLGTSTYTDARLALIEAWLSAHFYAISNKETSMETVGSVSEQYQYKLGLHLANTMYGQQAMGLDTSGKLAALNEKYRKGSVKASLHHVGEKQADLVK